MADKKTDTIYAINLMENIPGKMVYSHDYLQKYIKMFEKRFTEIAFARQEAGVLHNSFEWGYQIYECVKANKKEQILQIFNSNEDIRYGVLSHDPLRSGKDLVICMITTVLEFAMLDKIIDSELALTAGDTCIQLVEEINRREDLIPTVYASLFKIADLIEEYRQCDYHYLVKQTKTYIYKHFHEDILVEKIAGVLGVTPTYLTRVFKKVEGVPMKQYIMKEKIYRAKNLLQYSDYSIIEISRYLCFSSQSHFTKVFGKLTGQTPNAYRKQISENYKRNM